MAGRSRRRPQKAAWHRRPLSHNETEGDRKVEEDLQRTATNGGPCYTVVLLNKPAVEISESKEVKAISEWFRTESQLPGYLAIAPVVGIAHAMTAHAGATPGTTAVATTDTPIRRRPGRKKGFKVKRTMPGERSLAAGAGG